MSMVERVARALYADWIAENVAEEFAPWEKLGDKVTWRGRARAAIEAMRDPDKVMLDKGTTAAGDCIDSDYDSGGDGDSYHTYQTLRSDAPLYIWHAMVDAALK